MLSRSPTGGSIETSGLSAWISFGASLQERLVEAAHLPRTLPPTPHEVSRCDWCGCGEQLPTDVAIEDALGPR